MKTLILAALAAMIALPAAASVQPQPTAPQADEHQAKSNHGGQNCRRVNGVKVCTPSRKT